MDHARCTFILLLDLDCLCTTGRRGHQPLDPQLSASEAQPQPSRLPSCPLPGFPGPQSPARPPLPAPSARARLARPGPPEARKGPCPRAPSALTRRRRAASEVPAAPIPSSGGGARCTARTGEGRGHGAPPGGRNGQVWPKERQLHPGQSR